MTATHRRWRWRWPRPRPRQRAARCRSAPCWSTAQDGLSPPPATGSRPIATRPRMPRCWCCAPAPQRSAAKRLVECDLWVTLEPCAMCAAAIAHCAPAPALFRRVRPKRRRGRARPAPVRPADHPSSAGDLRRDRRAARRRIAARVLRRPTASCFRRGRPPPRQSRAAPGSRGSPPGAAARARPPKPSA